MLKLFQTAKHSYKFPPPLRPSLIEMFLVTPLVTVRTHTNTLYPAKKRKEAHKRAS